MYNERNMPYIIADRAAQEQDNTIFLQLYGLALANSCKFLSCIGLVS